MKSTTHSFFSILERSNIVFIFTDMKLLVIIALGMKYFIAWSAAGSYNEYDQNVYDEEQQNPILKAKLGALLLGKNLLLGKLLLGKKILLGGLPGFPYHRYPYGKFRHGYGLYGHSKRGRKFHVEQHDPILKEIFGAPLLGNAFSLGKQLLGKLLLGNSGYLVVCLDSHTFVTSLENSDMDIVFTDAVNLAANSIWNNKIQY